MLVEIRMPVVGIDRQWCQQLVIDERRERRGNLEAGPHSAVEDFGRQSHGRGLPWILYTTITPRHIAWRPVISGGSGQPSSDGQAGFQKTRATLAMRSAESSKLKAVPSRIK